MGLELAEQALAAAVAGEDQDRVGPVLAGEREPERRAPRDQPLEAVLARDRQRALRRGRRRGR